MLDKILKPLPRLYKQYRKKSSNESEQTLSAQALTKSWQEQVVIVDHIEAEVEIKNGASEKIDIIDFDNQTAYELKVSGNNPHHEFYKDIFKVLAFKKNYPEKNIKRFVFVSEKSGIDTLESSTLYKETIMLISYLTSNEKFTIKLVGIETTI